MLAAAESALRGGISLHTNAAFEDNRQTSASEGIWIETEGEGVVRIDGAHLEAHGLTLPVAADRIGVRYEGKPIAIHVEAGADDWFDADDHLLFFAERYEGRFQRTNSYRLEWGRTGLRMTRFNLWPIQNEEPGAILQRTVSIDFEKEYRPDTILPAGVDPWFGEPFGPEHRSIEATYFFTPTLVASGPASVEMQLYASSSGAPTGLEMGINGTEIGRATLERTGYVTLTLPFSGSLLVEGVNRVGLRADLSDQSSGEDVWMALGSARVDYASLRRWNRDGHLWVEVGTGPVNVRVEPPPEGEIGVLRMRDLTEPEIGHRNHGHRVNVETGYGFEHRGGPARYLLYDPVRTADPLSLRYSAGGPLVEETFDSDYIAIVHPQFWDVIDPLLDHRSDEGFQVQKVSVQDIYDQYGYGRRDPGAIRSFLNDVKRLKGGESPIYVLLVGDGHYDFRAESESGLANLIPPYLAHIDPWLGETASDVRYDSMWEDRTLLPRMHIGRLPVQREEEVSAILEKISLYESSFDRSAWLRRFAFVADDQDAIAYDFHAGSDRMIATYLPSQIDVRRLYLMASDENDRLRRRVRSLFAEGVFLVQWFGHGSRFRWGSTTVFNILDPPALDPVSVFPIVIAYACWNGYFINIDADYPSLAESLLNAPSRGAVAVVAPSGLHVGAALSRFNGHMLGAVMTHRVRRLGSVVDQARAEYAEEGGAWPELADTMILLGDPALLLPDPSIWTQSQLRHSHYLPSVRR